MGSSGCSQLQQANTNNKSRHQVQVCVCDNKPATSTCLRCRVAGSVNSLTALMTVDETEEVETESEAADAASSPAPLELRRSSNEVWAKQARSGLADRAQPRLSSELAGEGAEAISRSNNGSLLQNLQLTAERLLICCHPPYTLECKTCSSIIHVVRNRSRNAPVLGRPELPCKCLLDHLSTAPVDCQKTQQLLAVLCKQFAPQDQQSIISHCSTHRVAIHAHLLT